MKKFFQKYLIGQMLKSKKFWYAISSVVIPAIVTYLGVDSDTAKRVISRNLSSYCWSRNCRRC